MRRTGQPSEAELQCLDRRRLWEGLIPFVALLEEDDLMEPESCGGGGGALTAFFCPGYEIPEMSPARCLANQLSPMCLPGWPCETCGAAVGVGLADGAPKNMDNCSNNVQKPAKCPKGKMPAWLKDATPAVRRAYGG